VKTGLALLEEWYVSQCHGDWEHSWGVKIDTLDNPGWSISIHLDETRAETRNLERLKIVRTENDGIH
jgi:immunity protein 53 of polymorphic toxin system